MCCMCSLLATAKAEEVRAGIVIRIPSKAMPKEIQELAGKLKPNMKILDVGAGYGEKAFFLANVCSKIGCSVTACDYDRRFAQRLYEVLDKDSGWCDARDLPYPSNYADVTLFWNVIMFIDDKYHDKVIHELKRVTKPGGLIYFSAYRVKLGVSEKFKKNFKEACLEFAQKLGKIVYRRVTSDQCIFIIENSK